VTSSPIRTIATPSRALALVAAIGSLPRIVRIDGCEAADVDDYQLGLSPSVELATGRASEMAICLLKEIRAAGIVTETGRGSPPGWSSSVISQVPRRSMKWSAKLRTSPPACRRWPHPTAS
jgi:hypothetical protein